jgi:hypothetical protein
MCKLVSVNVSILHQRATDLAKASNDPDLTLTDLRAIMRGQAGLLADQADLAERVAAFERRRV